MVDRQGCEGMCLNDGGIFAIFSTDLTLEGSIFQRAQQKP